MFALAMMLGVAATLSAVALLSVAFRTQIGSLMSSRPELARRVSRVIEGVAGLVLCVIALVELAR
jgi:ABC-type nickel/cobalt efflux system permease component RcnA